MMKLHKALACAARFEKEQFLHAVEVMQILAVMGASEDLQIAGLFYGIIKRFREEEEEIRREFGDQVADWALHNGTVDEVEVAEHPVQLLVMADAVANLRRLTCEHEQYGDVIWQYCKTSKDLQSWYYSEVQDVLCDMQDDEATAGIYWEFVDLYKNLFVTYYLDDGEGILYQIAHGLYGYALERKDNVWNKIEDQIPEHAEQITRQEAETLEELWEFQKEQVYHDETLDGNERLEEAISQFRRKEDKDSLEHLADVLARRMEERGHVLMPIEEGIEEGNLTPRTITTDDGEVVIAAFTNQSEMKKGPYSEMLSIRIQHLFEVAKELDFVGGIVLNPWGEFMYVGKDLISVVEERVELLEDEEDEVVEFIEISTDSTLLN